MAKRKSVSKAFKSNFANFGYEAQLWKMADALRGSMDAAEYKHVALGLIFIKYISDAFEVQHAKLQAEVAQGADPEDPEEYRAVNIFWVPPEARWAHLKAQAKQPTIGRQVDEAMTAIERDNPTLKGMLPKEYGRPALDKQRLGQLIDFISNISVGDEAARTPRELTDEDIARTYHPWRTFGPHPACCHPLSVGEDQGEGSTVSRLSPRLLREGQSDDSIASRVDHLPPGEGLGVGVAVYRDIPGFCKYATLEEIRKQGHVLTRGRYMGAENQENGGEPFEEKMARLVAELRAQQAESEMLDAAIAANLKELGYDR